LNPQQTVEHVYARIDESSIVPTSDALKGGDEVGSRVRVAASTCLVASGLFMCGLGGALAIAEPSPAQNPGVTHPDEGPDKGATADSTGTGVSGPSTSGKVDTRDTGQNGNGGNPGNGNCGNDGSNGNAQHCGGGTPTTGPKGSTTRSSSQTSSSQTSSSPTSITQTSSTQTSTTKTSTETSTKTTETTTSTTTTTPPGLPGPGGGGGGGGGGGEVPSGRPELPPQMQLPPELMPSAIETVQPSVLDVRPGVGAAAAELPVVPISLPVIVSPSAGLGGGGGASPGAPSAPALPGTPRGVSAEPPAGREPLPANVGSNVAAPASSYRIGYGEYLRSAGMSQVAALAVPGVTGILVLTGAGGLVGYRQARAGHAVRTGGTARFIN
jgi:hypothetical protein